MLLICQNCGQNIEQETFTRNDICPKCGIYLKSCIQCKNYDPNSYHSCKEPMIEEVSDKNSANFCEYYKPNSTNISNSSYKKKDDVLNELDKLFKK